MKAKCDIPLNKDAIEKSPATIVDEPAEGDLEADDEARMPKIADVPRGRRAILKAEATSLRHLLTHKPKDPFCDDCCRGKMCAKGGRRGAFQRELKGWGSLITGDHLVGSAGDVSGLTD